MVPKKQQTSTLPEEEKVMGNGFQMDSLDLEIVNELLDDSEATSTDIARKYNKPLSTIQRRRTRLEKTILKKDYSINVKYANWRSGEIFMSIEKGRTQEIGRHLFEKYATNMTLVTTTLNNVGNLIGHIYYRSSPQMFSVIEELKKIESVKEVMYAEHIEVLGDRKPRFILEELKKTK